MNKKILQLIFLLAVVLSLSGCVEDKQAEDKLIDVISLQQINNSLENGPVLIQMGYDGCPACKVLKPIMIDIQSDYQGKATVMYLNTHKVPSIAVGFGVGYVPDSFVIADIEDGRYRYIRYDGQVTNDRSSARFVGVVRKDTLTNTLDAAISARNN